MISAHNTAQKDTTWGVSVRKNHTTEHSSFHDEYARSSKLGRNIISIVSLPVCFIAIAMYCSLNYFFESLNLQENMSQCDIDGKNKLFNSEEIDRFQMLSALASSAFLMSSFRAVASLYFAAPHQRSSM